MKVFTKVINLQHFMPTRYNVEFDLGNLTKGDLKPEERQEALKKLSKTFQNVYLHQNDITKERNKAGVAYFFKKLTF